MPNLSESHIRKIVREVLSESLILEISAEEKTKVYAKSNERVPFSSELMKQAILQGREIGMNFRTSNDKYEMPTVKARVIHPVALGTTKNGKLMVRGLHITGQSEKEARRTGVRSAEVEAEKDGINAWRMFNTANIRSMWFTDRFFSDNIPGFNPNDSHMTSKVAVYNPTVAKQYQDGLVTQSKTGEPVEEPVAEPTAEPAVQPTAQARPQMQTRPPVNNKDLDQLGYENPIQEKNKKVRSFFK